LFRRQSRRGDGGCTSPDRHSAKPAVKTRSGAIELWRSVCWAFGGYHIARLSDWPTARVETSAPLEGTSCLLRAGVDINTIRAWLGLVSLDTVHVYADADMEMKANALTKVDISAVPIASRRANATASLMTFLKRAIDRYFQERNESFAKNPRRAGQIIWVRPHLLVSHDNPEFTRRHDQSRLAEQPRGSGKPWAK